MFYLLLPPSVRHTVQKGRQRREVSFEGRFNCGWRWGKRWVVLLYTQLKMVSPLFVTAAFAVWGSKASDAFLSVPNFLG